MGQYEVEKENIRRRRELEIVNRSCSGGTYIEVFIE